MLDEGPGARQRRAGRAAGVGHHPFRFRQLRHLDTLTLTWPFVRSNRRILPSKEEMSMVSRGVDGDGVTAATGAECVSQDLSQFSSPGSRVPRPSIPTVRTHPQRNPRPFCRYAYPTTEHARRHFQR
jgi:hypothetical protein